MDPFQIRLECLTLLRRLNASQQSIAKVVDYAVRHAATAADGIWDCILSECCKTTLNARLNILFLVDALLLQIVDPTGFSASSTSTSGSSGTSSTPAQSPANLAQAVTTYLTLVIRDLERFIMQGVVPSENWDAIRLNATSTEKVLASWKRLNIFDSTVIDDLITQLQSSKLESGKLSTSVRSDFSKQDVLRRIDEDRERHKRLRERAWILPAKSFIDAMPTTRSHSLSATPINRQSNNLKETKVPAQKLDAMEIEFDYLWDNLSDLEDDDLDRIKDSDRQWWGSGKSQDTLDPSFALKRPNEEVVEGDLKRHQQSQEARM